MTDPGREVPGRRVLELVSAMDRLRSPGGCPWDAEQTHASLAPYAVEEAHELAEAVVSGDRRHLVEELGDVLLQVVFHARVGEDHPTDPFDLDDVAGAILAKLHRRHPHVFDEGHAEAPLDAREVERQWERIKAAEKPERTSPLDGIPVTLPALQKATKVQSRTARGGVAATPPPGADPDVVALWEAADRLRQRGVDAEQALGALVRQVAEGVAAPPRVS